MKTNDDAKLLAPYIIPYMLNQTKQLPQTRDEALVESFTNKDVSDKSTFDMETLDEMTDAELEESFRT